MRPRKRLQLIFGGTIILSALAGLIVYSFNQNLVYDHSVSEYLSDPGLHAANSRIYGKVKEASVVRATDGIGISFAVPDGERSIPVAYAREVPDTFKENGDVVVEGQVAADGVFHAHNLLAKCPSKYEGEVAVKSPAYKSGAGS